MPTILLVEDEPAIRELLVEVLSDEGYTVVDAANGLEALDLLARQAPDLVLTDVMMPGLDGLGVVRRIQGDPRTARIPIILMSAALRERSPSDQSPRIGFVNKPFDLARLLDEVRTRVGPA
jgi:CheY-like chemotaxis protein